MVYLVDGHSDRSEGKENNESVSSSTTSIPGELETIVTIDSLTLVFHLYFKVNNSFSFFSFKGHRVFCLCHFFLIKWLLKRLERSTVLNRLTLWNLSSSEEFRQQISSCLRFYVIRDAGICQWWRINNIKERSEEKSFQSYVAYR